MAPAILARGGLRLLVVGGAPAGAAAGSAGGAATRLLSAQAKPTHLRQYLDAWMGATGVNRGAAIAPAPQQQPSPSSSAAAALNNGTPLTVAGKSYLVPTLRLPRGVSPEELRDGIQATTSLSAGYFQSAPIVVDLVEWTQASPRLQHMQHGGEALDGVLLRGFIRALRAAGLHPVGIANATASDMQAAALEEGLPCFMGRHTPSPAPTTAAAPAQPTAAVAAAAAEEEAPSQRPEPAAGRGRVSSAAFRKRNSVVRPQLQQAQPSAAAAPPGGMDQEQEEGEAAALAAALEADAVEEDEEGGGQQEEKTAEAPRPLPTKVVQGSVRTGQQVFAEGCSLVVLGHVNSGAEVSADGDIHVYGKLTGRALAGLSGDPTARIFAGRFHAELVAIGDVFTTCDQPKDLPGCVPNAPTTVALDARGRRELVFHSFKV